VVANNTRFTIAAPGSTTTNAPPSGLVAATSQFTLTETSTTYGAQEQTGFGGTLSGGYGISGTFSLFLPATIEFWFTAPSSAPASTQYIIGNFINFVSLRTDMKIGFNGSSSLVMTAGHRYHIACTVTLTGHAIYMTDITAAGSGTRVYSDSSGVATLPAGTNLGIRYLNGTGNLTQAGATVDEVVLWDYEKYTGTTYTAPSAPYTGLEAGIVARYPLDTSGVEVVCA